jgi:hypothetical protein
MSDFTLSGRGGFLVGDTVTVDEVDVRDRTKVVNAAVATATVQADGTTPLTGLTDGKSYRATCNGVTSYFKMASTVAISSIYVLSAAEYAALQDPDTSTLYVVSG